MLAFNVLMRITRGNDAEKKAYWADYGAHLPPVVPGDRAAMASAHASEAERIATLLGGFRPGWSKIFLAGRAPSTARLISGRPKASSTISSSRRTIRSITAGTLPRRSGCGAM
ncbi:MAG: hypothetical protein H6643_09895 [Caldilineaceae bacterium]|nr:hypothetical protein [Caldilineaceae bacterium]